MFRTDTRTRWSSPSMAHRPVSRTFSCRSREQSRCGRRSLSRLRLRRRLRMEHWTPQRVAVFRGIRFCCTRHGQMKKSGVASGSWRWSRMADRLPARWSRRTALSMNCHLKSKSNEAVGLRCANFHSFIRIRSMCLLVKNRFVPRVKALCGAPNRSSCSGKIAASTSPREKGSQPVRLMIGR